MRVHFVAVSVSRLQIGESRQGKIPPCARHSSPKGCPESGCDRLAGTRTWSDVAPIRPHRVLIVDDEAAVRDYVNRVLVAAGYEAITASDAAEALTLVGTAKPIDLLITDVIMPEVTGDELARRIRRTHPQMKVLYITGFADRLFSERPVLWEDEAFIEKPFSVAGLREAVSLALFGHTRGPEE